MIIRGESMIRREWIVMISNKREQVQVVDHSEVLDLVRLFGELSLEAVKVNNRVRNQQLDLRTYLRNLKASSRWVVSNQKEDHSQRAVLEKLKAKTLT
jgi:hypothetical protein